jgi:hypothetical protein
MGAMRLSFSQPEQNEQHCTHRCLLSWFSLGFDQTIPPYAAGAKKPGLVVSAKKVGSTMTLTVVSDGAK